MDLRDEKCHDHAKDVHAHTHSETQKLCRFLGDEHIDGKIQGPTWTCRSHCWICGEWVKHEFECTPEISFPQYRGGVSRVYLRISSDQWAADEMAEYYHPAADTCYKLKRYLPRASVIQYCFVVETDGGKIFESHAADHECQRRMLGDGDGGVLSHMSLPPRTVNRVFVNDDGQVLTEPPADFDEDSDEEVRAGGGGGGSRPGFWEGGGGGGSHGEQAPPHLVLCPVVVRHHRLEQRRLLPLPLLERRFRVRLDAVALEELRDTFGEGLWIRGEPHHLVLFDLRVPGFKGGGRERRKRRRRRRRCGPGLRQKSA